MELVIKGSCNIRDYYFWLSTNILGESESYFFRDNQQGKVASETTTFYVESGQFRLCFNLIPGSFDHQYLLKESIDTFARPLSLSIFLCIFIFHQI